MLTFMREFVIHNDDESILKDHIIFELLRRHYHPFSSDLLSREILFINSSELV